MNDKIGIVLIHETSEQTFEIIKRFTPEAQILYTTKGNYTNLEIKSLYIKLSNEKGFSVQLQNKMIKNRTAQKEVTPNSDRLSMISNPKYWGEFLNNFINK